jgi:hypothetical protein
VSAPATIGKATDTSATAGISWYRTKFDLTPPSTQDSSPGLTIGTQGTRRGNYRALIFVNSWIGEGTS